MEKLQERLEKWEAVRSGGLSRYILLRGALPWGLSLGPVAYIGLSLLFQFEIFSLAGFFRFSSCVLFFSYCGIYFSWHRWRTEEYIRQSRIKTAGDR